jgi:RNA polymerase sigma-70 factor (sigma-E family)
VDVVVSAPRDQSAPDFESWATARLAALTRFAYLVTGSQSAADDAVQSALVSVCERWSRISRRDDPDAYVRRMVVNAHISSWRKSGRREWPVSVVRERTVSDHADDVAGADAIWRLCVQLPAQQRAAVVLRFYEDLGYVEIAAILGVTQATARSHVHRALEALRRGLRTIEEG